MTALLDLETWLCGLHLSHGAFVFSPGLVREQGVRPWPEVMPC